MRYQINDSKETIQTIPVNPVARCHRSYVAIAEQFFQKKLLPDEVVHHIDGDHGNNDPKNLVIMKRSQHSSLHAGLMGALSKWREKVTRPLCNTCLFVRLYDRNRFQHPNILLQLAETIFKVNLEISSNSPVDEREMIQLCAWLDDVYKDAKSFKEKHHHDCYEGNNLEVLNKSI